MSFEDIEGIRELAVVDTAPSISGITAVGELLLKEQPQFYADIYEATAGLSITPQLLQEYVRSQIDRRLEDRLAIVRGYYTGALLQRLAERGEPVLIDGNGGRFDYLFRRPRFTPPTVVMNLYGHGIFHHAGERGSAAITLINVVGSVLASSLGVSRGRATALLVNTSGSGQGMWSGSPSGRVAAMLHNVKHGSFSCAGHDEGYCKIKQYGRLSVKTVCLDDGSRKVFRSQLSRENRRIRDMLAGCAEDPIGISMNLHRIMEGWL